MYRSSRSPNLGGIVSEVLDPELAKLLPDGKPPKYIAPRRPPEDERDVVSPSEADSISQMFIRHENDNHRLRHQLIPKIYQFIQVFLFFTLAITILSKCMLGLSDNVIIALLTTTTANVLGMFFIALKWLYK